MNKKILSNIKNFFVESFSQAWNGKEKINNIFIWWGIIAYLICYFILNPLIVKIDIVAIDVIISLIIVSYFIFHIILIRKNSPKKPKLTKAQEKKLKEEKKKDKFNSFVKKLLLKEPLTKWRPGLVFGAIDLFIITNYVGYII